MTAIFVTATGTDIGKTFVAAGLIRFLRASGREVDAVKPVATGFDKAKAEASDPGVLLAALGRPVHKKEIERISPWRYAAPLSPDMAAQREGGPLDFDALVTFCTQAIAQNRGTLLIEGIGGVMVPLDDKHTVLDLMTALRIPAVLVIGSYLGTLSHTLTALDVLRRRLAAIKAIVINETPGSSVPLTETAVTLSRFAGEVPVVTLPRLSGAEASHPAFGELAGLL